MSNVSKGHKSNTASQCHLYAPLNKCKHCNKYFKDVWKGYICPDCWRDKYL